MLDQTPLRKCIQLFTITVPGSAANVLDKLTVSFLNAC